ncbi:MAG TPA: S8 family serine peptidase [Gemmatimonadales bacterium]|nr:S8 family serine peptidase [Gemmatimonadales bacterium]
MLAAAFADHVDKSADGEMALSGLLESIGVRKFPVVRPKLHVTIRMRYDKPDGLRDHRLRVVAQGKDGHEYGEVAETVKLPAIPDGQVLDGHHVLTFCDIHLTKPDRIRFLVSWDNDEVARLSLSIVELSPSATRPLVLPPWLRTKLGGVTGKGIKIGIADSGFDRRLEGVTPSIEPGVDLVGTDADADLMPLVPDDHVGHGTACLTTAFRVAPGATFVPIRVFGGALYTMIPTLCRAVRWAADNSINVLNLSLRISTASAADAEALFLACEDAQRRGVIMVAASPDDGQASLPAWFESVIAVERNESMDPFSFEYFSSGRVEIAAPSGIHGQVLWRGGGLRPASVASYAVPVVSGIIALILERYPQAKLEDVRAILAELSAIRSHSSGVPGE